MRPMQQMLPPGGKLIYTEAPEAFMLYIRIAIIAGLVIAAPLIMWQLWLFVAPALYREGAPVRRFPSSSCRASDSSAAPPSPTTSCFR